MYVSIIGGEPSGGRSLEAGFDPSFAASQDLLLMIELLLGFIYQDYWNCDSIVYIGSCRVYSINRRLQLHSEFFVVF